jgi:hypothetical protein
MVRRSALVLVWTTLAIGFSFEPLWAQIDMGSIAGTVKDPAGAVVADARLILTNQETGVARTTSSSSAGTYVFAAIPPGLYTLRAEAPGFSVYVEKNMVVRVQSTVTADVSLVVGGVTQEVTVTSSAPLLQAQSASVGQTVGSIHVNALPLNGRDWRALAQVQPGNYFVGSGSIFANGVEPGQVDYRVNGVNDNEEVFGGINISPVPDAIQEFRLQEGNNSAEFGHSVGAVVNAVTKSGTNQLKGDIWEFNRNEVYNANDYFSNQHGVQRPKYRQNQFGGLAGGPVHIPRVYDGRDRTFFFFDFQRTLITRADAFTDTIPTDLMRNSGFTNLQDLITGSSGRATDGLGRTFPHGTVFDPATTRAVAAGAADPVSGLTNTSSTTIYLRDPFYSGSLRGLKDFTSFASQLNMIPASRLDPRATKLLMLLPRPTQGGLLNNYFVSRPKTETRNQYDVRVDQNFSARDRLFGVFSRSTDDSSNAQPFDGFAGGALEIDFASTQPVYVLALSETHIFSPTLLNEARLGINRNFNTRVPAGSYAMGVPVQYGIQGIPQISGNGGLPTFEIHGFSSFGGRRFMPTIQTTGAQDYTDNLTWVHGRHEFKTGVQVDRIIGHILQPAYSKGDFVWNGQYADIPNQNTNLVGIADFLLVPTASTVGGINNLGGPSSYNGSNYASSDYNASYLGAYVQDDWRVTPVLTVNLGLRWEYFGPYDESHGGQANLIMTNGNGPSGTYYIGHAGCGVPRSTSFNSLLASYNIQVVCEPGLTVNKAQLSNFAPRFGLAYRVRPNVVVRTGFGISYGAFDSVGYGGTLGTNYPFQYTIGSPSTTSQIPITLSNGQTANAFDTFGTINLQDPAVVSGQNLGLTGKQYSYDTPYAESLNVTVQDQFTDRDSFELGYVGTLGRHLDAFNTHNAPSEILPPGTNVANYRPFPNLSSAQFLTPNASSDYHAMQAIYEHRFTGGLAFSANYSYGRCMSNDNGKGNLSGSSRHAEWLPGWGLSHEYTLCPSDSTHVLHLFGEYALPFGKGERFMADVKGLAGALIGGWQLNYIYTYQSGSPFTVGCPVATTADFGCYALLVSGQNPYAGPHNQDQWLNPRAFAEPPTATSIGQTDYAVLGGPAGQVRGPSYINLDVSLFKKFTLTGHTFFECRLEAFNALNRPQFGTPGQLDFTNLKNFSRITGLRGGTNPRVLQLAGKIYF